MSIPTSEVDAENRSERSFEIVARAIEKQILERAILPGQVLSTETELAAKFGVHRSTLREALRSLEQSGLVYREKGRRKLKVGRGDYAPDALRPIISALVISEATYEDLYEAMRALEPALAAKAAERASTAVIAELEENLRQTRLALDDKASLTALDIEFHHLVAKAADNKVLDLTRRPPSQLFYPAFYPIMSRLNAADRLIVAHEHILDNIRAGDCEGARTWMERHIDDFQRGYQLAGLDLSEPIAAHAAT